MPDEARLGSEGSADANDRGEFTAGFRVRAEADNGQWSRTSTEKKTTYQHLVWPLNRMDAHPWPTPISTSALAMATPAASSQVTGISS